METKVKLPLIQGDISHEQTCKSLMDEAINRFGGVDVLVNNAGIGGSSKKISELTENDWNEVIDVNLKGAFLCTREALKHMLKNSEVKNHSDTNFSIINISSVHRVHTFTRVCPLRRLKRRNGDVD